MCNSLPSFPTIESSLGSLKIHQDLTNHSATISFSKEWISWHVDTDQILISNQLIHFVEPNGNIVGIKVFSEGGK